MTRDEIEDALTFIRDMFLNDQIVEAMSRVTGHELEPKEYEILKQLRELASDHVLEYANFFDDNREVMEYFGNIFKLLLQGVQIASGNGYESDV